MKVRHRATDLDWQPEVYAEDERMNWFTRHRFVLQVVGTLICMAAVGWVAACVIIGFLEAA